MQKKLVNFSIGSLFFIVDARNGQALTVGNKQDYDNSQVGASKPNDQNINQLWMVQQIFSHKFQIIHAPSCFVMQSKSGEVRLKPGQRKPNQFWNIKICEGHSNHFNIIRQKDNKAMCLDGILKYRDLIENDPTQQWCFFQVKTNKLINRCCIITSCSSNKVIDVPRSTNKKGVNIIQYKKNGRFNQRWIILTKGQTIIIKNLKSRLNLDIEGESKQEGAHIIQWPGEDNFIQNTNQLWRLQKIEEHKYLIRSLHAKKMILGIQNNSNSDEAKLVITSQNNNYLWNLQGYVEEEGFLQ